MNVIVQTPSSGGPYIWTCHHVGVNSSGGSTSADRSAVQWLQLEVSGASLSLTASGKIYDATSRKTYYHHPSVAVNSSGDALLGFSGGNSLEHRAAFYSGKKAGGSFSVPAILQLGRGYCSEPQWGHYSMTALDTSDGSFWTIQEFAAPAPPNFYWGTWIGRLVVN